MLWKDIHPVIEVSTKVYEKGIPITKSGMKTIEKRLKPNPELPKWDIYIEPQLSSF